MYKNAIDNGAICGKLLGSGNGGFFLFLVEEPAGFMLDMDYDCFEVQIDNRGTQCILNTSIN